MHEMHFHYQEQPHPASRSTWAPSSPLGSHGQCWHMQDTPCVPCPWASAWRGGGSLGSAALLVAERTVHLGDQALGVKVSIDAVAAIASQPQTVHHEQNDASETAGQGLTLGSLFNFPCTGNGCKYQRAS